MLNRFRFRVWDYKQEKYLGVNDVSNAEIDVSFEVCQKDLRLSCGKAYSIEQCTGLEDKNGELIYENDIVELDDGVEPVNAVIEWDEDACCNYAEKSDGDVLYQVWIEDEDSTEARLGIISAQGVRSIAGWKLGLENANTWNIIDSMIE